MANITQIYQNALQLNSSSAQPVYTTITLSDVQILSDKIKKYKINGWNSCRLFLNETTTDINILIQRYNAASQIVYQYEQQKDQALNDVYAFIKPYIKSMIEQKYIPHIQDVISASEVENYNNSEISSALKALASELSLKNIHVLIDENIAKSTLEKEIIDIIRVNTVTGNETTKLNTIQSLNTGNQFITDIYHISPNQTQQELEDCIWKIMTNILYEVKSIDEIKAEVRNNPLLGNREKPIGHEINEILNALPPVFKELIKYKMMTNIPNSKKLSQGITSLKNNDFLTEIDMLLMTLGFNAEKQVIDSSTVLSENTEAFIDFRYLQKLSSEKINELLSSLSTASYMILDYVLKNESISKKDVDVHDYNSFSSIFSQDEYNYLTNLISQNNLDPKTTMYYYAFIKNYIGTRTLSMDDKKFKNINELFKIIRSNNNIATLGTLFKEWYENIDLNTLSVEELNELTLFSPEFMYPNFSQTDKLIYKKCKAANIEFQYYYKLNPHLFDAIIKLHKDKLQGKSIPQYYFYYTIKEISYAYNNRNSISANSIAYHNYNGIIPEVMLESERESLLNSNLYSKNMDAGLSAEELEYYLKQEIIERRIKKTNEATRANNLRTIIQHLKNNGDIAALVNFSKKDIEDAKLIIILSKIQLINPEYYLSINSETLNRMFHENQMNALLYPPELGGTELYSADYEESLLLAEKRAEILAREIPKMKEFEPTIEMKFLTPGHIAKNMELFFEVNNDLVATPSFIYKTPYEVDEVIKLYQQLNIEEPLPEEILYFSNEEIKNNMKILAELIQNEKDAESFSMESIDKIRKIIQKRKERQEAKLIQKEKPNIKPITTRKNELDEMFVTISPEFLEYASQRQKVQ